MRHAGSINNSEALIFTDIQSREWRCDSGNLLYSNIGGLGMEREEVEHLVNTCYISCFMYMENNPRMCEWGRGKEGEHLRVNMLSGQLTSTSH